MNKSSNNSTKHGHKRYNDNEKSYKARRRDNWKYEESELKFAEKNKKPKKILLHYKK